MIIGWRRWKNTPILRKISSQNRNIWNKLIQKLSMCHLSSHESFHHSMKRETRRNRWNSRLGNTSVNINLIPSSLVTTNVGSKQISLVGGSTTVVSTWGLLDELALGLTVFFCGCGEMNGIKGKKILKL